MIMALPTAWVLMTRWFPPWQMVGMCTWANHLFAASWKQHPCTTTPCLGRGFGDPHCYIRGSRLCITSSVWLLFLPMGWWEEVLLQETSPSLLTFPSCRSPPGSQQFLRDTKYASWDKWTKLVCQICLQAPFRVLIYLAPMLHGPF